jgi:hypothetical protein
MPARMGKIIDNQFWGHGKIHPRVLFIRGSGRAFGKGEIQIGGGDYGVRIDSLETFQGISTISRI